MRVPSGATAQFYSGHTPDDGGEMWPILLVFADIRDAHSVFVEIRNRTYHNRSHMPYQLFSFSSISLRCCNVLLDGFSSLLLV